MSAPFTNISLHTRLTCSHVYNWWNTWCKSYCHTCYWITMTKLLKTTNAPDLTRWAVPSCSVNYNNKYSFQVNTKVTDQITYWTKQRPQTENISSTGLTMNSHVYWRCPFVRFVGMFQSHFRALQILGSWVSYRYTYREMSIIMLRSFTIDIKVGMYV